MPDKRPPQRKNPSGKVVRETATALEYTDAQFDVDVRKAAPALEALAEKARKAMKDGSARKFPA
jgi:hypothetical protein